MISQYSSILVICPSANKRLVDSIGLDFDVVIDPGFVGLVKLNLISGTNILQTVKLDFTEYMARARTLKDDQGVHLQLYSSSCFQNIINENNYVASVRVIRDVTDSLFELMLLGENFVRKFKSKIVYSPNCVNSGVTNLVKSKLIRLKSEKPNPTEELSMISSALIKYELTDLGRQCGMMRQAQVDCRTACLLLNAREHRCCTEAVTLVTMIGLAHMIFENSDLPNTPHLTKLYTFYNGNSDLEFLLLLYRQVAKFTEKKDRMAFFRKYGITKRCMIRATKQRQLLKSALLSQLGHFNTGGSMDDMIECFVAAYPSQIARYNAGTSTYQRPGFGTGSSLLLDPNSWAQNDGDSSQKSPPQFVFYFTVYTVPDSKDIYMQLACPISQQIWDKYSLI